MKEVNGKILETRKVLIGWKSWNNERLIKEMQYRCEGKADWGKNSGSRVSYVVFLSFVTFHVFLSACVICSSSFFYFVLILRVHLLFRVVYMFSLIC